MHLEGLLSLYGLYLDCTLAELSTMNRRLLRSWKSFSGARRKGGRGRAALCTGAIVVASLAWASSATAAPTSMVDLGVAANYAVLSGASVGNTVSAVGAPHTTLRGNLGVKAATDPTGFPPGVVTGTMEVGTPAASAAHAAAVAAYAEIAGRTGGSPLAGALAGATLSPGLYTIAGAASNTTTLTLNAGGNANAVFVFQVGGALAFAANSHVVLTGGAQASRVFWQVNGAGAVGADSDFAGTMIAMDAVGVGNSTIVNGRMFARTGALTLDNNQFYSSPPLLTIAGGSTAYTTDTTPTVSGLTDVEAPALVSITLNGQALSASASAGSWAVTSAILANATYTVTATVTDGAGNTTNATQQLVVDTQLPVVALDGGASAIERTSTPTISGLCDSPPGTLVHISVGSQSLTALVQANGSWNIRAGLLADGSYTVTGTVEDLAGNEGSDTQSLLIDTLAPAASIFGGANALTNDATPLIVGTAAVNEGTSVSIDLADETLAASVTASGTWSVVAPLLVDGPHRVTMTVADSAGNTSAFTQTLMIDTRPFAVAMTGGASRTTSDMTPTLTGTSDAPSSTTVSISVSGQTMTALVQPDGTWNATTSLALGSYEVTAAVADAAGNIGSVLQTLTIATAAAPADPVVERAPVVVAPVTAAPPVSAPPSSAPSISAPPSPLPAVAKATTSVSVMIVDRTIKAGQSLRARGSVRSAGGAASRVVKIQIWRKIGSRWVLRRTMSVRTSASGAFTASYRVPSSQRGAWRVRASAASTATAATGASRYVAAAAR